jgi:acetate kinase
MVPGCTMNERMLLVNCGSSSVKFQIRDEGGRITNEGTEEMSDPPSVVQQIWGRLPHQDINAVGHRLVNGFQLFLDSVLLDDSAMGKLKDFARSSAVITHRALDCVEAFRKLLPAAKHFGVFDSQFHRTLAPEAYLYALPLEQFEQHGIRRWGFHGLSHQSVSERFAPKRVVTCHLGNGASVCAIRDGQSVDTSMGYTAMEGLVMGTRAGDVDSGIVLDMIVSQKLAPEAVGELLNHHSGLRGLSGLSGDVRELEKAAAAGDMRAQTALAVFCHRVRKYIGAFAAVLGGIDVLVFTGGIGEHSASQRRQITRGLDFLGIELSSANESAHPDCLISSGPVETWVIKADEERILAREVKRMTEDKSA